MSFWEMENRTWELKTTTMLVSHGGEQDLSAENNNNTINITWWRTGPESWKQQQQNQYHMVEYSARAIQWIPAWQVMNGFRCLPDVPECVDRGLWVPELYVIGLVKTEEGLHGFLGHVRHALLVDERHQAVNQLQRAALDLMARLTRILGNNTN